MTARVAILCRFPEPGRCKTRLIPALGAQGAADVHARLARFTVETVRRSQVPFEVWGTGAGEGAFTGWLGPVPYRPQPDGDLGAKLLAAAEPPPAVFLGTDCPDLTPELVQEAAASLEDHDAVIGPAEDGGYWTMGMAQLVPGLLRDMPWGTDAVYRITRERMDAAGIVPKVLPTLADLDRPEDLERFEGRLP